MMELPGRCDIIIIGAGIAGCSTAYHLAQIGKKDIIVLEQGKLWATGGSTSHVPGGIADGDLRSETMSDFAVSSRALYNSLGVLQPVPSLKVARTNKQLDNLKQDTAHWQSRGRSGVRMISPEEAKLHHPLIKPSAILGAMFVPAQYYGRVDAIEAVVKLASRAKTLTTAHVFAKQPA